MKQNKKEIVGREQEIENKQLIMKTYVVSEPALASCTILMIMITLLFGITTITFAQKRLPRAAGYPKPYGF